MGYGRLHRSLTVPYNILVSMTSTVPLLCSSKLSTTATSSSLWLFVDFFLFPFLRTTFSKRAMECDMSGTLKKYALSTSEYAEFLDP